jgi:hypothetical protein
MRRAMLLVGAVVAVTLAVAAVPAAANNKPVTGPRIAFFPAPPTMFVANSPFHIEQGFSCLLNDTPCVTSQITGQSTFHLYLDGVLQPSTPDVDVTDGAIRKLQLTNYPNGLHGTHMFVGVWILDGAVTMTATMTISFV